MPKAHKRENEKIVKITLTFEMEEEQLRDLFESCEVKFSKKKAKELQGELEGTHDGVQIQLEEPFEEIITDMIQELFE
jgi:hypothetical protein